MNSEDVEDARVIKAVFYKTEKGNIPVMDWVMKLSKGDRKIVGEEIRAVELGWPRGVSASLIKKLEAGLWEVRTRVKDGRLVRVIFTVQGDEMILLHAFFKKTQKTPTDDLDTARKRLARLG